MTLSIIIPALNEVNHIGGVIHSLIENDSTEKEIFIVDGGSTDGTQEKVLKLNEQNPNIKLLHNKDKYVSHGFNLAFRKSKGEYISLVGAHAKYPPNYFALCIDAIKTGKCDVAGGFLNQEGNSFIGKAISISMSSKFGVGNTEFRTVKKEAYVDSVAFAVYSRKVFEGVGLLDTELIRNQDDEFHYRINKAGYKILLIPELELTYFVRDSISRLFSQYYQYGYYKPLVFKKVKSAIRIRHIIPLLFVVYLFSLPFFVYFFPVLLIPIVLYLLLAMTFSLSSQKYSWKERIVSVFMYPILHTSYGLGYLKGLLKWK